MHENVSDFGCGPQVVPATKSTSLCQVGSFRLSVVRLCVSKLVVETIGFLT